MYRTCTSKKEAKEELESRIAYYVSPKGNDYWRMYTQDPKNLDIASFLASVGYRKRDFEVEWERHDTRRVKVGSHSEIKGYSGKIDDWGNVNVEPEYETVDDYENQEYLADSGKVTDTVYYCFPSDLEEAKKLRDEFTNKWLDFYSKNEMREHPEGRYLKIQDNTFDRSDFHFIKEEETQKCIKTNRRMNLPFFLISLIPPIALVLAFLFNVSSFAFPNFGDLKDVLVLTDSFFHLNGTFNYAVFYPIWAACFAIDLACCIYYGRWNGGSSWLLLITYVVIIVLGSFITNIVLYGVFNKRCGFDFFAFLLGGFSLVMGLIVWLVMFFEKITLRGRIMRIHRKQNERTQASIDYFSDFQSSGKINEYLDYLKRWSKLAIH